MLDRAAERYADDNYGGGEAARWALEQPPALRTIFIDRQARPASGSRCRTPAHGASSDTWPSISTTRSS